MRSVSGLLLLALAPLAVLRAEVVDPPAPLAPVRAGHSAGSTALRLSSAQRAQALGFPSTAVTLLRGLLAEPGADAGRISLALASALLDEGDGAAASRVLEACPQPHGSAWHLRAGLAAAYARRWDVADGEAASARAAELSASDRGWLYFLQGLVEASPGRGGRGGQGLAAFNKALTLAVSDLQRARFMLAWEQARLRSAPPSQDQIDSDRRLADQYQGQKFGYGFAREYAAALAAAGRRGAAIDELEAQLRILPPRERAEADEFRLLLGMIGGAAGGSGRNALLDILESGVSDDRQRTALELLFEASGGASGHEDFRQHLDSLISRDEDPTLAEAPPILESLLLYRAELALEDSDFARAEGCAQDLLARFPGTSLKAQAYDLLAGSAWEQRRFRNAADFAFKARAELPPGVQRAALGVLVAEAWFREGDFRSAADAYEASLKDPPFGIPVSLLLFQRVLSEMDAGQAPVRPGGLRPAEAVLDEEARSPLLDPVDRWRAEWNLARALEVCAETPRALARIDRLLSLPVPAGLTPEFRARMGWLRIRLSLDAHHPADTVRLAGDLMRELSGLPDALRADVSSNTALLAAEADFELGREAEGLAALADLRARFPGADPAVYSYIVEADHDAAQDRVADAQKLLASLADRYPDSAYAPYALYQAALQAERLGQDTNLQQSYRILEGLWLNPKYRSSGLGLGGLIFQARMRQGDLLRKLNEFPQAEQMYFSLVKDPYFAGDADVILAWLALAECHSAQSVNDPTHADRAMEIFQDLVERVDAPPDVRVEAGYSLGDLLRRQGQPEKAATVWWSDVVNTFLVGPGAGEPSLGEKADLGEKGRYWLARTLVDLGDLQERQGRLEEAKRAWLLLVQSGMPFKSVALDRLARFHLPLPSP